MCPSSEMGVTKRWARLGGWLRSSQRPPEPASRPHTLLIQPAACAVASTSLAPGDIRLQPLTCKMASFESIGSCSLDAYATASEASEHTEDETASARTLRSVPLVLSLETEPSKVAVASGASSPEYVKRTARLFEVPSGTSTNTATTTTPNIIVENGGATKDSFLNGTAGKKPSYLGLACSISGYSGITTYDSKLREGFRSRDHSPGRIGLTRSRDTSPLRPDLTSDSVTCFKSECGNFLTPPTKTAAGPTLDKTLLKSIISESAVQKTGNDLVPIVNGAAVRGDLTRIKHHMNGTMEETKKSEGRHMNGISEMTTMENISESATSHIRESSRNFMSSMLSENFDSIRTKELFGITTPINKTASSESPEGFITSPIKPSPDSSKSVSKDSLSPASGSSPQKRSPGAVRVVEFTSQTKSYVKTVISSRTFLATSSSVDSPFTNISDMPHTSLGDQGNSHQQQPVYSSSSSVAESNVSSTPNCSVNKSFIQQRVERLYGPGALAQGFFRRTRLLSRSHDESQEVDASPTTRVHITPVSSPGLPVLRHLRPEFRAQLPLTVTARRRRDGKDLEAVEKIISVEPVVLQQQVSVESIAESLPDMQPAAPEVVLPVETVQPIVEGPKIPELEPGPEAGDKNEEKDGHFYLKLLKQEIERMSLLVAGAEEELGNEENLPEEALGKLRAASGQARLLMKQKLQQFEGLCHKNISQSPQEAFPTTSQDLAGFWDMVKLQIDHVDRLFEELRVLRRANWVEQEPVAGKDTVDAISSMPSISKRRSASKRIVTKPAATEEQRKASEAARKAREESRRKLMEERRKAMRQKVARDDTIEIYVPQENGKVDA